MARVSSITFGQVAQIADAMKAAGHRPTARAVRERIGSGSMGTIHKLLQQWTTGKVGGNEEDGGAIELPSHISKALVDFIGSEVATACEPIQDELQEARNAADALATENERLEEVIEQLRAEREEAEKKRAIAQALQTNLTGELDQLKEQHRQTLADLNNCDKERAVLVERCQAYELRTTDLTERLLQAEKRNIPPASEFVLTKSPPDEKPAQSKPRKTGQGKTNSKLATS